MPKPVAHKRARNSGTRSFAAQPSVALTAGSRRLGKRLAGHGELDGDVVRSPVFLKEVIEDPIGHQARLDVLVIASDHMRTVELGLHAAGRIEANAAPRIFILGPQAADKLALQRLRSRIVGLVASNTAGRGGADSPKVKRFA